MNEETLGWAEAPYVQYEEHSAPGLAAMVSHVNFCHSVKFLMKNE